MGKRAGHRAAQSGVVPRRSQVGAYRDILDLYVAEESRVVLAGDALYGGGFLSIFSFLAYPHAASVRIVQ